ncbi:hypothetical protein Salat_2629000 [Sesamum alatum]|uniref:Uncharacterized protein n=1 Tax=Sesamum alatum TaxID=300844 RepID=A0AAE2CAN5_9LAMI|nr:hypothetical protein Salat_2629000 [Sesamum alatum]
MTEETLKHILLECPFAWVAWAVLNLSWQRIHRWTKGAAAWFSSTLQQLGKEDGAGFLMICWALWQNRNRRRKEGFVQDPQAAVGWIFFCLLDVAARGYSWGTCSF